MESVFYSQISDIHYKVMRSFAKEFLSDEYPFSTSRSFSTHVNKKEFPKIKDMKIVSRNIPLSDHKELNAFYQNKDSVVYISINPDIEDGGFTFFLGTKTQERFDELAAELLSFEKKIEHKETHTYFRVSRFDNKTEQAVTSIRSLETPAWNEISSNYNHSVRDAVDPLMKMGKEEVRGRILLLHGAPGTGKTHILRALARETKTWCDTYVISDPERMFNNSGYLFSLFSGNSFRDNHWKLFILEDCDELIGRNADGQALSRLLNSADGIIGQGLKIMFAITTNEDLVSLHPAVTRPGRSMGSIAVNEFNPQEAQVWLKERGKELSVKNPMTLAQMYEILNNQKTENHNTKRNSIQAPGLYM